MADEREQVERHLIVATPRNIAKAIVYDSRHNIHVHLEHGRGIDSKRSAGLEARKRLDRVKIDGWKPIELKVEVGNRKIHINADFSAKIWTV